MNAKFNPNGKAVAGTVQDLQENEELFGVYGSYDGKQDGIIRSLGFIVKVNNPSA